MGRLISPVQAARADHDFRLRAHECLDGGNYRVATAAAWRAGIAGFADERAGFIPLTRKIAAPRTGANSDSNGRSARTRRPRAWNWPIRGEPSLRRCGARIRFGSPWNCRRERRRHVVVGTLSIERGRKHSGDARARRQPLAWRGDSPGWNECRTNRARIADSGASEFVLGDMWYRNP